MKTRNDYPAWVYKPCWYVTCKKDGSEKIALLLGGFDNEADCRKFAYRDAEQGGNIRLHHRMKEAAIRRDQWAVFYSFGMVLMKDGLREGILNDEFPEVWSGRLRERAVA